VGEPVPPREAVVVLSKKAVPPRERVASKTVVVPSKTALWEMGCRVTFPLVELMAQIERCPTPMTDGERIVFGGRLRDGSVPDALLSEEGVKVFAYSVEWRRFIKTLLLKIWMILDNGGFGKVRTLGSTWGMKIAIMLLKKLEQCACDLPGYVLDTGVRSVRKAASGAGSD
jgi:hypothetical protein